ncbi:MAG: tetratricopeptide repeat protein [Leptolyngbya sp. SIO1E4]|nr:tetratricopeptide repeat protein [Leptolyngbya sp. SIO1E4]
MLFGKRFKRKPKSQPTASSQTSQPEQVISPWQAQNQETIDELARFVDFAEGFTIGFIEINFTQDLDELLKVLLHHPDCRTIKFEVFDLSDPTIKHLQDELLQKLENLPPSFSMLVEQKQVIVVKGLENAVGMFGDYPPVLQDLNFVRDALIESVPHPVLFCLPSYSINRVIQFAPDFWSWKSGLFKIKSVQSSEDNASIRGLHATKILGNLNQLERQERIQLLERLAQEFDPLAKNCSKADLRIAAQALTKLGYIHLAFGEFPKAQSALEFAAQIFQQPEWQPETLQDVTLRIRYLNHNGDLEHQVGNVAQAEQCLQMALMLNDNVDPGLKANTCLYLGRLKANQGQVEAAMTFLQESLTINERIGHIQSQAATLHAIANLTADRGKSKEAMALYQEVLAIKERIGDVHNQAVTLSAIAKLKVDQGEVEAAMALFQESLEIEERIGHIHIQAAILREMGVLQAKQGHPDEAISLLREALTTFERTGSGLSKARTLWRLGETLAEAKGDFAAAIPYLEDSLTILKRIGSPDASTVETILHQVRSNDG